MVYLDNLRPEEKLAHQTRETEHYEQLPLTRSKPYPDPLPRSLNSPEQIMREQQETQHRRELKALWTVLADRDVFFSRRAMRDKEQPNKADHYAIAHVI